MALSPLEIQKVHFKRKLRGLDPTEVENFLAVIAEELAARLGELEKLERENRYFQQRLAEGQRREQQLQETLLRAQKVSEEMTANAEREAELRIKEADLKAEQIVNQSLEQASKIEAKIAELRRWRRELQLKFKNTLDLFQHVLKSEMEEESTTASVHTLLPGRKREE